jgi:hypothetical protein
MRFKRAVRVLGFVLAAILVAAGAWVLWIKSSPRNTPAGQPGLSHLSAQSLPELRDAFNGAQGQRRLVVLLSPT